jgi:predicted alpha/beta-fold hydrolase
VIVIDEPMLKEHVKKVDDKRRLDIAATYWQALSGGHFGFSHSDQKDCTTATDKVEGYNRWYKEKVVKYGAGPL